MSPYSGRKHSLKHFSILRHVVFSLFPFSFFPSLLIVCHKHTGHWTERIQVSLLVFQISLLGLKECQATRWQTLPTIIRLKTLHKPFIILGNNCSAPFRSSLLCMCDT